MLGRASFGLYWSAFRLFAGVSVNLRSPPRDVSFEGWRMPLSSCFGRWHQSCRRQLDIEVLKQSLSSLLQPTVVGELHVRAMYHSE